MNFVLSWFYWILTSQQLSLCDLIVLSSKWIDLSVFIQTHFLLPQMYFHLYGTWTCKQWSVYWTPLVRAAKDIISLSSLKKIICANGFNRIWCVWMKHHFSATTCLLPWIFVIVATTQSMSWWCEAGKEEKEYDGLHKN